MAATLTPQQRAMLAPLMERPRTATAIVAHVYAGTLDGGPVCAEEVVRVQMHRIRRAGIVIENGGPGRPGYRIAPESRSMVDALLSRCGKAIKENSNAK